MPIGDRDWYREDFERKHRRNDPPFKRVDHCLPKARCCISVTEVDNGVIVKNTCSVPYRIGVKSPEGERQFELNVGESVTVTGITEPIEVWGERGVHPLECKDYGSGGSRAALGWTLFAVGGFLSVSVIGLALAGDVDGEALVVLPVVGLLLVLSGWKLAHRGQAGD